jgi:hypothetical protein
LRQLIQAGCKKVWQYPLGNSTRPSREIASYVHHPGGAPGPISGAPSPTGTGWPPSSDPVLIARAIARCVLGGVADLLVSSFCATCRNGRRESRNGDVKRPAHSPRPLQDQWQNHRRRAALFLAHRAFDDGGARRHPTVGPCRRPMFLRPARRPNRPCSARRSDAYGGSG